MKHNNPARPHSIPSSSHTPTTRLYRDASYAQEFQSSLQAIDITGDSATIILEQTLFYAAAGGQPSDHGLLYYQDVAIAQVVQVSNCHKHGATVIHQVKLLAKESALELQAGSSLTGKIDWQRRYRHMQRHSAQHILSQSFLRSHARLATVSVNLHHAECSIDFAGEPNASEIARAFEIANSQGYARATIQSLYVDSSALAAYPLRRPAQVQGNIRLVYVSEASNSNLTKEEAAKQAWELSACGGTHVANASEIVPLHFLRSERVKGLTRVYFICGWEALADYRLKHEVAYGLSNDFSSQVAAVPARVHALQESLRESKAQNHLLQKELASNLLQQWQEQAETLPLAKTDSKAIKLIVKELEDNSLFKNLGHYIAHSKGLIGFFAAPQDDKVHMLFVASDDISLNLRPSFQAALQLIEGKGGGKATFLQGAGTKITQLNEALAVARATLTS